MSQLPTSEIQRHRFGPRAKGGIVFGLRGGQIAIMTTVLILMTVAVRSTSSVAGAVAGLLIFGLGALVAFLPIRRRALDQWLPIFASYWNRQLSGHTRWLSRAHLQGHHEKGQSQEGRQDAEEDDADPRQRKDLEERHRAQDL